MKVKFLKKMSKILSSTRHLIILLLVSCGSFSQSDVKVLDEIDPDYNYKIAKRYYQMAKDAYGAG